MRKLNIVCNSVLNWFTPKYLKKNWKIYKFLLKNSQKVLNLYFIPLTNPRLKFFPNTAPYSNDAPYCLVPSCKNQKLLIISFQKNIQDPNFWNLIPLNPWIKTFFKIPAVSVFLLYRPPTSCKVSGKTNERSLRYLKTDGRTNRRTNG